MAATSNQARGRETGLILREALAARMGTTQSVISRREEGGGAKNRPTPSPASPKLLIVTSSCRFPRRFPRARRTPSKLPERRTMRIEREDGTAVGSVWAVVSRNEAWNLLLSLQNYFEEPPDPGWHTHVGSDDHELTIAIDVDPPDH